MSGKPKEKEMDDFFVKFQTDFVNNEIPLTPEFEKFLRENYWELLE